MRVYAGFCCGSRTRPVSAKFFTTPATCWSGTFAAKSASFFRSSKNMPTPRSPPKSRAGSARCMDKTMKFTLEGKGPAIDFTPERVIIAGYTGRNQEETRAHIRELERQGIPTPAEIPAIFRTTRDRLTTDAEIEVVGDRTA